MRAAIQEFNKNGFARTTVEEIAQAAGIAKGSIYQYFEDKRDLFLYCADWGLSVFMKNQSARMKMEELDVFEYFLEDVAKAEVISEERDLVLFMQLITREPGLADESMARMYRVANEYIVGLILTSALLVGLASFLVVRGELRKTAAELMKGDRDKAKVNFLERRFRLERFGLWW